MIPIVDSDQWLIRLMEHERPGADDILAFYEHRIGAICRDAKLLLAPLDDHLVHRGDGVFETLRYANRAVLNLDQHLERLQRSAGGLEIPLPCPATRLREIILAVARASKSTQGSLRVLMGRGPGGFGINPAESSETSLYIVAYRVHPRSEAWYTRGLSACRSEVPVKPAMLAKLKTTNYLSGVLMSLEATRRGVDISFSFDAENCLAEAAIANVALVDAGGVFVLPEFRNALPGTTAMLAASLLKPEMPVLIRPVPESELFSAREIMVLGTAHECVGVHHYEGRPIGTGKPGPVAARLRTLLRAALQENATPF